MAAKSPVLCFAIGVVLLIAMPASAQEPERGSRPERRPVPFFDPMDYLELLRGDGAPPPPTATTLRALQGDWEGTGPPGEVSIRIEGGSLHFFARADYWYQTTFTLPEGTDPQQLHATIEDSSSPNNGNGQVVFALVEVEDGALRLAVDDGSDAPPASFSDAVSRYDLRRPPLNDASGSSSAARQNR